MRASDVGDPPRSALARADLILRLFNSRQESISFAALVARSGLPRTTAYRTAETMVRMGWLSREQGRYAIGRRLFEVGSLAYVRTHLREDALPFLQDLYEATHETVHLSVLEDLEVLYVEKITGHRRTTEASRVGGRLPLYCTGVGKVLLAFAGEQVLDEVLRAGLIPRTDSTITSPERLRQELAAIRREGVGYDRGEYEEGTTCVAAPIYFSDGFVAAISVTGPRERLMPERLISGMRVASLGISRRLADGSVEHGVVEQRHAIDHAGPAG